MKKIFLCLMLVSVLFLTGCGKLDDKKIKEKFVNDVANLKGYYLEGELSLTNNDDTYKYDVKVSYAKDDNFKVILTNKNNNYEQTILRNNEGVYVITPSLNKSFKFQSEWPYNNSQSYLLQSVAQDLKNDEEYQFAQKGKDYIFTTKTNYPNNPNYTKQNIILDENNNLKKVEVLDDNNISYIVFTVTELDKKATFDDEYFELDNSTEQNNNNEIKDENKEQKIEETNENDKTTNNSSEEQTELESNTNNEEETTTSSSTLDEALFPLYLPENTALSNKEIIDTTNGQRVIMTFAGDNPFILVQETVTKEEELTIVPTYGEPYLLIDTVGSLTDMSYTWTSNGIEYYIVSDVMATNELLEVAKSINVVSVISEK